MTDTTTLNALTAQVQKWHETDHEGFRTKFDAAIRGVRPIPEGANPSVVFHWAGANVDTLCGFLEEWYHWMPKAVTGLEYIQKLSCLYHNNNAGLLFATTEPALSMTRTFLGIQRAFMDTTETRPAAGEWIGPIASIQMPHPHNPQPEDSDSSANPLLMRLPAPRDRVRSTSI